MSNELNPSIPFINKLSNYFRIKKLRCFYYHDLKEIK